MTWILVAYLIALIYLSTRREKSSSNASLRQAWITFALIPLSHFVFTLFRIGNYQHPRDLALIELWATGFEWLLLGISLLFLTGTIAPENSSHSDTTRPSTHVPPAPPSA